MKTEDLILYAKVGGPPNNWHNIRVFLNDVDIGGVIEADVKNGWLIKYKRNEKGKLVLNDTRDEVLTEKLFIFLVLL